MPIKNFHLRKVTYYAVGFIFLIPLINTLALLCLRARFSQPSLHQTYCRMHSSTEIDSISQPMFKREVFELSIELHEKILSFLPPQDLARTGSLSRTFCVLSHSSQLWNEACIIINQRWRYFNANNPSILQTRTNDVTNVTNWKALYLQYNRMELRSFEANDLVVGLRFISDVLGRGPNIRIPNRNCLLILNRLVQGEFLLSERPGENEFQLSAVTFRAIQDILSQVN